LRLPPAAARACSAGLEVCSLSSRRDFGASPDSGDREY